MRHQLAAIGLAARLPGAQLPQVRQAELPLLGRRPPGPWAQWILTHKVKGKTRTRVIPASEVDQTRAHIAECQRLRRLVGELIEVSEQLCQARIKQGRRELGQAEARKKKPVRRPLPKRLPPRSRLIGPGSAELTPGNLPAPTGAGVWGNWPAAQPGPLAGTAGVRRPGPRRDVRDGPAEVERAYYHCRMARHMRPTTSSGPLRVSAASSRSRRRPRRCTWGWTRRRRRRAGKQPDGSARTREVKLVPGRLRGWTGRRASLSGMRARSAARRRSRVPPAGTPIRNRRCSLGAWLPGASGSRFRPGLTPMAKRFMLSVR